MPDDDRDPAADRRLVRRVGRSVTEPPAITSLRKRS